MNFNVLVSELQGSVHNKQPLRHFTQKVCLQIIQTQSVLILIHSAKTHFQNIFVTLYWRVAKGVVSSLVSFRSHIQCKCALQT